MTETTKVATAPKIELKGLRTWATDDGGGYQVTLYVDGRKTSRITQDGHGGPTDWEDFDTAALERWLRAEGMVPGVDDRCDGKRDIRIAELIDDLEHAKQLKRWCRKWTIFTLPGDKAGEYRNIRQPYSPKLKAQLLKKYPNVRILNEEVS